jgi:hypothetical protein
MNVKIGTEAEQFPEKEYINGIAVAVCAILKLPLCCDQTVLYNVQVLEAI